MKLPVIRGVIERRILTNFHIDPDVLASLLPAPFRPKTVNSHGIGGICMIRLRDIRPRYVPAFLGVSSENAAHRFAVEWDDDGDTREGVYIPRRDTSSKLSVLVGGRLFPGVHHLAHFTVEETQRTFAVSLRSADDETHVSVSGEVTDRLPESSVFQSLREVSDFFEAGSLGYSSTSRPGSFDGLELRVEEWAVEPLAVSAVSSSFFEDEHRFPAGSMEFDCALLMRDIDHEWLGRENLCCPGMNEAVIA